MRQIFLFLMLLLWIVPLHAQDELSPYDIALQRIEDARESGATRLQLYKLGDEWTLTELPPEIGELTNLRVLALSESGLSELPPEIGQLTNLEELYLDFLTLSKLPPEIGQLTNLRILRLEWGGLSELPPEIGQLTNLEILWLGNNNLTELLPEIGQLTNLNTLVVSGNNLTELPPEIGQLTNLCYLNLANNNFVRIPNSIGYINRLASVDACSGLNDPLTLDGNPLISPPPEVVEQGTEAVLAYLRHQAWYHTQRWIIGIAAGVGMLVLFMLGFRFKQRGSQKMKNKRGG